MINIEKKKIRIGLDWTQPKQKNKSKFLDLIKSKDDDNSIDLDLSVCFLSHEGKIIDRTVSYLNHNSRGVIFSNDDQSGDRLNDGIPNELILIEPHLLNPDVKKIGIFVNNLDGELEGFECLVNATLSIHESEREIIKVNLHKNPEMAGKNCVIIGYLDRDNDWEVEKMLIAKKNKNIRDFELLFRDSFK